MGSRDEDVVKKGLEGPLLGGFRAQKVKQVAVRKSAAGQRRLFGRYGPAIARAKGGAS